ncbi:MAG: cellulase family glycosylhydrolase [Chloroflexota bacterium]|jgi:polysaccharide biosynthesis protein PslG
MRPSSRVILLFLLSLSVGGCTPANTTLDLMGDEPVVESFTSPDYGIHTSMWWDPEIMQRDLRLVEEMGFNWVKQKFPWREIEGIEKGQYDWYRPDLIVDETEKAGLELLVRLDRQPFWSEPLDNQWHDNQPPGDYQDFADFCGAVAERYRGRIAAYQVWNEPNLDREWGLRPPDPEAYTELLKVCYLAIKTADPDAIVISAGLAPTGTDSPEAMPDDKYLQGMYDAGAAPYFDVLGLNAPGYRAPPELEPVEAESEVYGGGRWFAFRHVEDMRAIMVANGDGHKQVAILEMGWTLDQVNPEYAWFAVDEPTQADYLVRAFEYAADHWQPWMGLMVAIYIADAEWTQDNEQWWWAIVLPDGTPRAAYDALRRMPKVAQ